MGARFDIRREVRRAVGGAGGRRDGVASAAVEAGGDWARFLLLVFVCLPELFFATAGAVTDSTTSSSGIVSCIFVLFAPRVKTKSPSCSSYATIESTGQ